MSFWSVSGVTNPTGGLFIRFLSSTTRRGGRNRRNFDRRKGRMIAKSIKSGKYVVDSMLLPSQGKCTRRAFAERFRTPLVGESAVFAGVGGTFPAPACPGGETGKGDQIPSVILRFGKPSTKEGSRSSFGQ